MPTPEEILRQRVRNLRQPIGDTTPIADEASVSVPAEGQQVPQAQPDLVSQYQQTGEQTAQAIGNAYADLAKTNQDIVDQQQKANEEREKSFAQLMQEQRNEYARRVAENEQDTANYAKATRYTGSTELASALINLAGVAGLGAENQQYKTYSTDWMQKVEKGKEANKAYRDTMGDKLRQLQLQQDALKQGNLQSILNLKYNGAKDALGGQVAEAQQKEKTAQGAISLGHQLDREAKDDAFKQKQLDMQAANMARQERQAQASLDMQAARYGMKPDGKGGYVADETNPLSPAYKGGQNGQLMGTGARSSSSSSRSGSGSGSSSAVKVTVPKSGEYPSATFLIDPMSFAATINAITPNSRTYSKGKTTGAYNGEVVLTPAERNIIMRIESGSLDEKKATMSIAKILGAHPELRPYVMHSSLGYQEWNDGTAQPVQQTPAPVGNSARTDFNDEPESKGAITFPGDSTSVKKKNNGIVMP